jgi:hypothetical protein
MRPLCLFALSAIAQTFDSWSALPLLAFALLFVVADTNPLDVCHRCRR